MAPIETVRSRVIRPRRLTVKTSRFSEAQIVGILKMLSRRAKGWSDRPDVTVQHAGAIGSFAAAPKMAIAVRADPASNAAFLELFGKLTDSGAVDPGDALSDCPRDSGAAHGVDEGARRTGT